MEEKDSLAVYYGKNFWTAPQGAPAQAVPVDWQFTWAGHLCRIPALYVSDAGLTLDVLLFLDSGCLWSRAHPAASPGFPLCGANGPTPP